MKRNRQTYTEAERQTETYRLYTDVTKRRAGTEIMMSRVVRGETLTAVRPAYDNDPATPAAPVPELQVDTWALQTDRQMLSDKQTDRYRDRQRYTQIHTHNATHNGPALPVPEFHINT